jgi:hypothetical protein
LTTITVNSYLLNGAWLAGMGVTVSCKGNVVGNGYTPLTCSGSSGQYSVTVMNYGQYVFDHWSNNSTSRTRTGSLSQSANVTWTAHYRTANPPPPHANTRGVYVPLYSLFSASGTDNTGVVVNVAAQYPNMRFIVAINPNNGPGTSVRSDVANAIGRLVAAPNIRVIGYLPTGYAYAKNGQNFKPSGLNGTLPSGHHVLSFNFVAGKGYVKVFEPAGTAGSEYRRVQGIISSARADTSQYSCPGTPPCPPASNGCCRSIVPGVLGIKNIKDEIDRYRSFYPQVSGLVMDEVYNWPYDNTSADPCALLKQQMYRDIISYARSVGLTYFKANLGAAPKTDGYPTLTEDHWTSVDVAEGHGLAVGSTPLAAYLYNASVQGTYWSKCSATRKTTPASSINQANVNALLQCVRDLWMTADTDPNPYDTVTNLSLLASLVDNFNRGRGYY